MKYPTEVFLREQAPYLESIPSVGRKVEVFLNNRSQTNIYYFTSLVMTVRPVSLSQEKASILSSLTKQEYETVVLFCQERILADAEVLIQEGDQPVAMYILLS